MTLQAASAMIADSHRRSEHYGLRARARPDIDRLAGSALSALVERNRMLYSRALPAMEEIDLQHLPDDFLNELDVPSASATSPQAQPGARLQDLELSAIRRALDTHGGNVSAVARPWAYRATPSAASCRRPPSPSAAQAPCRRGGCRRSASHSASLNKRERVRKRLPVPLSRENMPPFPATTSMISWVCSQ
jgi:hypothetical protein